MKKIALSKGKFTLVDDFDYDYLNQWKWYCGAKGYAVRAIYPRSGKQKTLLMHCVILERMGIKADEVDHINRVPLDNRRKNLRGATRNEQMHNASKRKDNTSGFKGVTKHRGKRQAQIMVNGRSHYLGLFEDKKDAALAYNKVAEEHFGAFACVNEVSWEELDDKEKE